MAGVARDRLVGLPNVEVDTASFEDWDDRGRRFDLLAAASSWHWIDPSIGWRRAHELLRPGGWMALLGHVVARRLDEPEVFAVTSDLHQQFAPGNPGWGDPPLEDEIRSAEESWAPPSFPDELFGPTTLRWYPTVAWFDGHGYADLLRTTSLYRDLAEDVREPLLDAIAERIRTQMGDRASRRYLSVLRVGQRSGRLRAVQPPEPRAVLLEAVAGQLGQRLRAAEHRHQERLAGPGDRRAVAPGPVDVGGLEAEALGARLAPNTEPSVGVASRTATHALPRGSARGWPRARRMSWWWTRRSSSVSFGGNTRQVPAQGSRSSNACTSSAGVRPSARAIEYALPERSDEKPYLARRNGSVLRCISLP